jgi:hypothetical protein
MSAEQVHTDTTPSKKKRHIFRWVFLAIQALFLIWIITGASAAAESCPPGQEDACAVGGGIGVIMIIFLWMAVDVILGIGYLIFRKKG